METTLLIGLAATAIIHSKRLRKQGWPALRAFRVVKTYPGKAYVKLDTQGTTVLPMQSLRNCIKAPSSFRIFDDSSLVSGRVGKPPATAVDTPEEDRDLVYGEDAGPVLTPEQMQKHFEGIVDARRNGDIWSYLVVWDYLKEPVWTQQEELVGIHPLIDKWMEDAREEFTSKDYDNEEESEESSDEEQEEITEGTVRKENSESTKKAEEESPSMPLAVEPQSVAGEKFNSEIDSERYEQLRKEIIELGPFDWRWKDDINKGQKYKQFQVLRQRQGGNLGGKAKREWCSFNHMPELTEVEKARVRIFTHDKQLPEHSVLTGLLSDFMAIESTWLYELASQVEEGVM